MYPCVWVYVRVIHVTDHYLSGERGPDFSLAVGVGAVAGSAFLQRRQHVPQVLPLLPQGLGSVGRAVGVVAGDVPGAGLEVQHSVEKVLVHGLGHEEMHAAGVGS